MPPPELLQHQDGAPGYLDDARGQEALRSGESLGCPDVETSRAVFAVQPASGQCPRESSVRYLKVGRVQGVPS